MLWSLVVIAASKYMSLSLHCITHTHTHTLLHYALDEAALRVRTTYTIISDAVCVLYYFDLCIVICFPTHLL